jgi:hypothetical protein
MSNAHRLARRAFAVTAVLGACLAPLAASPAANASLKPNNGCIRYPGTGVISPCLQPVGGPPAGLP